MGYAQTSKDEVWARSSYLVVFLVLQLYRLPWATIASTSGHETTRHERSRHTRRRYQESDSLFGRLEVGSAAISAAACVVTVGVVVFGESLLLGRVRTARDLHAARFYENFESLSRSAGGHAGSCSDSNARSPRCAS